MTIHEIYISYVTRFQMLKRLLPGVLLLFAIAAVLLLFVRRETNITYITAPVERGDIVNTITVTGSVSPIGEVKVGSQLSGQLAIRLVDYNQKVKKDQPLARLDSTIQAASLREAQSLVEVAEADVLIKEAGKDKAESELKNAHGRLAVAQARTDDAQATHQESKSDFQRKAALAQKGTVSKSELDEAKAQHHSSIARLHVEELEQQVLRSAILSAEAGLRMAKAEIQHAKGIVRQRRAALDRAEIELERTVIRAPIDGIVIGRDVETGQTVAAALEAPTLFTLARDLRSIEVKAVIDEADIGRVHVGQSVRFTVAAYPRRRFSGKIINIWKAPQKEKNVVTYTVLIAAENVDQALFPGMTATIHIVVESVQDVLKIPNAALRFKPPEDAVRQQTSGISSADADALASTVVWVLAANGEPSSLEIRTGAMGEFSSELVDGPLTEGDAVIVRSENAPGRLLFDLPFEG